MFFTETRIKNKKGFSLIEAMTVLFIFVLITVSFYSIFTVGMRLIADSKNRLGASALANEKMEIIRNIKYENIGTDHGSVLGNILQDEDIMENNGNYHVHTLVEYVQDSFDGTYPADTAPEDYKKVTITVTWNEDLSKKVELVSRFVPAGLEVESPGDGILLINVFSDQPGGSGIPDSSVHVSNDYPSPYPDLDTTVTTDSTGSVTLMGNNIRNSIQGYEITLAKSGYETVDTLPPYPTTAYNPINTHASVVVGSINVINIVQNKLAKLKVATVDYLDQVIPGIDFHLEGGKILGNTIPDDLAEPPVPAYPVYNIDEDGTTDSSGVKDYGSISPGKFFLTLSSSVTEYVLIDTDPISPISLFSDDDLTLKAKLANKNATSLLVKVTSNLTDNPPVAGATVRLTNGNGYDVELISSATGTVFFPVTSDTFEAGIYDLKVTADGFSESNTQTTIIVDELKTEAIILSST